MTVLLSVMNSSMNDIMNRGYSDKLLYYYK